MDYDYQTGRDRAPRSGKLLQSLHTQSKSKIRDLEQDNLLKDARIKDLQSCLFGKKSEKSETAKSEKGNGTPKSNRNRGDMGLPFEKAVQRGANTMI